MVLLHSCLLLAPVMSSDCLLCNRTFDSKFSRDQHVAASAAHATLACVPCGKQFVSTTALAQHSASAAHVHLTPELRCPRCQRHFPSGPFALLMHLESGGLCARKLQLTRAKIARFVLNADTGNLISSPGSGPQEDTTDATLTEPAIGEEDVIELPRHVCEQCPPDRGQFASALSLDRHKNSPAHDPIIFHCPARAALALEPSAPEHAWVDEAFEQHQRGFKTLSGLAQHLEKGVCDGGMQTFYDALECVTKKLGQLGMLLRGTDIRAA